MTILTLSLTPYIDADQSWAIRNGLSIFAAASADPLLIRVCREYSTKEVTLSASFFNGNGDEPRFSFEMRIPPDPSGSMGPLLSAAAFLAVHDGDFINPSCLWDFLCQTS